MMSSVGIRSEPDSSAFVYVAMSGESERGGPGVAYVDRGCGSCKYLLVSELTPVALRDGISELLGVDGDTHYYIVVKDALNVHVMKHPRAEAHATLQRALLHDRR